MGMEVGRPARDVLDHHLTNRGVPLSRGQKRVRRGPPRELVKPKLIRADDRHELPFLIFRID